MSMITEQVERLRTLADIARDIADNSTDTVKTLREAADTIEQLAAIKTLEQEPCPDAISRQAAIDAVEKLDIPEDMCVFEILSHIEVALGTLPSAQRWIPCSERLPEAEYPVIVTWKNDDPKSYYQYILGKHYAGVAHYKNGTWYWYSSVTEDVLMEYGRCDSEEFDEAIKVLAWMPLPAPYRREGDEKHEG